MRAALARGGSSAARRRNGAGGRNTDTLPAGQEGVKARRMRTPRVRFPFTKERGGGVEVADWLLRRAGRGEGGGADGGAATRRRGAVGE